MTELTNQPNKRALLVGVNQYPNLPVYSQLRGCVNDVEMMKLTLETSFGFPGENIKVLVDEQATYKGITEALNQLVTDCFPNDIVVLHFSGHGSRMAAIGEKAAGYDESIMPHDSGRMNPDFPKQVPPCDIRDTEVQEWLAQLTRKTPHVTLIFDSCHSGSITRMQSLFEEQGSRLRWIEPDPLPNGESWHSNPKVQHARGVDGGSGWLPLSEKYVLLAACAAEQGAYELDHEGSGTLTRHGAFTFFLTQELNQTTESTYQDIWDVVSTKVNNRFQKQTPQLEGARDRKIFDVTDFVPARYLLVTNRSENQVTLAGGAIHGVTVGSLWEVFPPGTKEMIPGDKSQGLVKISKVEPVSSLATIIEEGTFPVSYAARAVEVVRADRPKLNVWLADAAPEYVKSVNELSQRVSQSNLVQLTDSAASARALVSINCDDSDNSGPAWEVVDPSQARLMTRRPLSSVDATTTIVENLETLCRYEQVLELRNEKSSLKGKVEFVLMKKDKNDLWIDAGEDEPTYKEGESIAFRIINRSGVALHVSILDLGLSKQIHLLYPAGSASETIGEGRSGSTEAAINGTGVVTVGNRPENEIELYFPERLNSTIVGATAEATRGKEVFKLCVTTKRHDLGFLKQHGLRTETGREFQHPFEQLLLSYVAGGSTRDARLKLASYDEWFTIERAFWLERKRN